MEYGTWLRTMRAQEKVAGVDHIAMACYASQLTPYVRTHLATALQDMEELYAQLPPVIALEEEQREHWENGRDAYIACIRGALDHIGAALNAVGCTDEQLASAGHNEPEPDDAPEEKEPSEENEPKQIESGEETMRLSTSGLRLVRVPPLQI